MTASISSMSGTGNVSIKGNKEECKEECKEAIDNASLTKKATATSTIGDVSRFLTVLEAVPESRPIPYIFMPISNETRREKTLNIMGRDPLVGQVMIFTSGFFGLDIASVRGVTLGQRISYIVYLDVSSRARLFWEQMQKIIKALNNRFDVFNALNTVLISMRTEFFGSESEERLSMAVNNLKCEMHYKTSWLSSDERFNVIREIFCNNRFIFKQLDICDEENMKKFNKSLSTLELKVDTWYLSNIREFVEDDGKLDHFHRGILALKGPVTNETLFVDTQVREGGLSSQDRVRLCQRVVKKVINSNLAESFPRSPRPTGASASSSSTST